MQFPRELPRKVEIQEMTTLVKASLRKNSTREIYISLEGIDDEYQWFIANGYVKYFLNDKAALKYEYLYDGNKDQLTITR